jgi:four helix bundle protein
VQNFRKLRVYQNAYTLVLDVYSITGQFPRTERFGLVNQMRRAAVSVVSNIAEGSARGGTDFARFLGIALGSGFELETQLRLCDDLSLAG